MNMVGVALFCVGYAVAYWAINILWSAYKPGATAAMNPAPLYIVLGIPSASGNVGPQGPAASGQ